MNTFTAGYTNNRADPNKGTEYAQKTTGSILMNNRGL